MSVSRKKKIKKYIDIDIDIVNTTRAQTRARTQAQTRTTNDGVILIVANTIAIATTHYTKIIEHEIKRGGGKGGKKLKVNGGKRKKNKRYVCIYGMMGTRTGTVITQSRIPIFDDTCDRIIPACCRVGFAHARGSRSGCFRRCRGWCQGVDAAILQPGTIAIAPCFALSLRTTGATRSVVPAT